VHLLRVEEQRIAPTSLMGHVLASRAISRCKGATRDGVRLGEENRDGEQGCMCLTP